MWVAIGLMVGVKLSHRIEWLMNIDDNYIRYADNNRQLFIDSLMNLFTKLYTIDISIS